jgi:hypothetical protein
VNTVFGWQSLLFYAPIAFGALLAVGAAFGLIGEGGDDAQDVDDVDDGDVGDDASQVSTALEVGRLPLTVRLMLLSFAFGGVGLIAAPLVRGILGHGGLVYVVSAGIAGWCALLLDRASTRWLARRLPLFETQTVRRAELVGAVGRVVLAASERGGVAQVRDARGDLHQVTCRLTAGETLPPGAELLLVEYDERTGVYLGERLPSVMT